MPKNPAKVLLRRSKKRPSFFTKVKRSPVLKSITTFVVIFSLVVLSLSFLGGMSIYREVTKGFVSAFSSTSQHELSQDIYTVLLIKVDDFSSRPLIITESYFTIYDIETKSLTTHKIDVNYELDMPGRFSNEPISKSLALGMLEPGSSVISGVHNSQNVIKKLFGYKVDRVIVSDNTSFNDVYEVLIHGNLSPLLSIDKLRKFSKHSYTNITVNEAIKAAQFSSSLPAERILGVNVGRDLLDNKAHIDERIRDITFDSFLASEKKAVTVLNGTRVEGLASFGSRIIDNLGGRAVEVDTATQTYSTSILICDDITSITCRELASFFNITSVFSKAKAKQDGAHANLDLDRPDTILVLGLDIAESMF